MTPKLKRKKTSVYFYWTFILLYTDKAFKANTINHTNMYMYTNSVLCTQTKYGVVLSGLSSIVGTVGTVAKKTRAQIKKLYHGYTETCRAAHLLLQHLTI